MSDQPRIEPIADGEGTEAQEEMLARLRRPDGTVLNIFRTMANHPDLARRWRVFGNHVLGKSTLSPRLRELVILRTGRLCRSEYEWGQHVLIAVEVGVSPEEIERLKSDSIDADWAADEASALVATDDLFRHKAISDTAWAELENHFTVEQMMDLVFTVGQYTLVSMALNSFVVQRDPGVPGFDGESS